MNEMNIQKCLTELNAVTEQLQKPGNSSVAESLMRLLKCIAFLEKGHRYEDEAEEVNEWMSLYFMHYAEVSQIVESINALVEKMN